MNTKIKIFIVFLFFALLSVSHTVRAQQADCSSGDEVITKTANNLKEDAQKKGSAVHEQFFRMQKVIAHDYNQCLNTVKDLFKLNGIIHNPMLALGDLMMAFIENIMNQACAQVLAILTSAMNSARSILNASCIPLPNLRLPGLGFSFPQLPCNGINLLQPQWTSPNSPQPPGTWQIWGGIGNKN